MTLRRSRRRLRASTTRETGYVGQKGDAMNSPVNAQMEHLLLILIVQLIIIRGGLLAFSV